MEKINVELRSISPLLMHRYCGAQPSKPKAPRGKKTQSHIDAEYKSDWIQSAYWQDGTFHIPAETLESALSESARAFRGGKTFKKALSVNDLFIPLRIYSGPDDKKGFQASGELEDYYKPEFVDIRGVRIGPSRIDRCRPIFRHWGLSFTVMFDDSQISRDQLKQALDAMAIGDFRPRYGRSQVVRFESEKKAA